MAESLEKSSKKLIDKYFKPKPATNKKSNNSANFSQNAEPKEEFKYTFLLLIKVTRTREKMMRQTILIGLVYKKSFNSQIE